MIRVVLVDDQMLVRRGIRTLLELGGEVGVVADVGSADEGIAAIREHRPDVVLLDVRMPGKNGIELLRELGASGELPATILLTTFDDDEALIDGMKAGARGFLLKDISLEALTAAIRGVAAGRRRFGRRLRSTSYAGWIGCALSQAKCTRVRSGSPNASSKCCGCLRVATATARSPRL
jgi:DNA-binding NarL/FixJ family response regulator